ncbi:polysaccharide deacetylase WbmS family protein [Anaerosalibacter sp. Marseille-P3206]|uniref:polysaccharide deacetylase WbmS family protein n=1 Tax=Anaerosalibacter sp. Marseille-P3206 TaxID=1871005 RepID=UPI000986A723|nr:hypothetical protein [Anaerosalibacter sp. Marseille-P3206]
MLLKEKDFPWHYEPIFCITCDIDWASDDALEMFLDIVKDYNIPLTMFLTHSSPLIVNIINKRNIDVGIHPNFLKGSSQGSSYKEIIEYCKAILPKAILPKAICFRCHRYFDVNDITEILYNEGFLYDSNLCTFTESIDPFVHRSGIIRFPVYFEDGAYLYHNGDLDFNKAYKELFSKPGLMVINIHPMHMVLNSPNFIYSRKIKDSKSREEWNNLSRIELEEMQYKGRGIKDYIIDIFDYIRLNRFKVYNLKQIYEITIKSSSKI